MVQPQTLLEHAPGDTFGRAVNALFKSDWFFLIWHNCVLSLVKLNVMPDDPNKKGADRKRVSKQTHEQTYQKRKAAKSNGETNNKRSSGSGSKGSGRGRS